MRGEYEGKVNEILNEARMTIREEGNVNEVLSVAAEVLGFRVDRGGEREMYGGRMRLERQ